MLLDCPRCAARYQLAEALLGPAGARVRCPQCAASFVVDAAGTVVAPPPPAPPAVDGGAAHEVARELVAGLVTRGAERLRDARRDGRLFAEWGPAVLDLFDEYRRRVGDGPGSGPFRDALCDQLGIDLPRPPA